VDRSVRSGALLAALLALAAVPAPAAAADVRRVVSTHVSFTGFDARVPAGAVVSVVQTCPIGSRLDRAATRASGARFDGELQPTVRRLSRELWPAGMVTRYRVLQAAAVPRDDGFGLVNAAVCTGGAPLRATSVSGRATTDVRLWGPAPAGVRLFSVTLPAVTDRPLGADLPYLTAVRAAGASTSPGGVAGGVRAVQEADDDGGSGSVMTTGTTLRRVPAGRFASMRSAYAYTADLTRRTTVTSAPPTVVVESRGGRCTVAPAQVAAGEHEVVLVAVDGPGSLVVRDPAGAVVLERRAVHQEQGEGPPVHGSSEPALLDLRPGDHAVECRPDGAPAGTATLRVMADAGG
jgi:hypothetical protein